MIEASAPHDVQDMGIDLDRHHLAADVGFLNASRSGRIAWLMFESEAESLAVMLLVALSASQEAGWRRWTGAERPFFLYRSTIVFLRKSCFFFHFCVRKYLMWFPTGK
jgi:hypothetical protein